MTPITTTLAAIRKEHPCAKGWRKVLAANLYTDQDEPISLADILLSNGLEDAYWVATNVLGYQVPLANQLIPLVEVPYWSKLFESWGDEHPGEATWEKEWDIYETTEDDIPHKQQALIHSILSLYDPDEIESEIHIYSREYQSVQFLAWVG